MMVRKRRGLAGAVAAEQHSNAALRHDKVDTLQNVIGPISV
jgi:hypothetical protein